MPTDGRNPRRLYSGRAGSAYRFLPRIAPLCGRHPQVISETRSIHRRNDARALLSYSPQLRLSADDEKLSRRVTRARVIDRSCAVALARGTRFFYQRLTEGLNSEHRQRLDHLLTPRNDTRTIVLTWLRQFPGEAKARRILSHLDRLHTIRSVVAGIWLHWPTLRA